MAKRASKRNGVERVSSNVDKRRVVLVIAVKTETRKRSPVIYSSPLGIPRTLPTVTNLYLLPGKYPNIQLLVTCANRLGFDIVFCYISLSGDAETFIYMTVIGLIQSPR